MMALQRLGIAGYCAPYKDAQLSKHMDVQERPLPGTTTNALFTPFN
jgi:hypothetical protein